MGRRPTDGTPEPFEEGPTNLDPSGAVPDGGDPAVPASDRKTGTYAGSPEFLAGREAGFEAGFKIGLDKATAALRAELTRAGATPDEIDRVVARIKSVAKAGR